MRDESANKMKIVGLAPIPFQDLNNHPRMEISFSEASSRFPGFRFSPTDEELIHYYLTKKLQGSDESVKVIPVVDICQHEPWDLPAEAVVKSDNEWFFFSPLEKRYPNGSQSKRATQYGYWKVTGKERLVKSGFNVIGTKKTLVFHTGRAPKGIRTEWIMHEYSTKEKPNDGMLVCRLRKNRDFKLNNDNTNKQLPEALTLELGLRLVPAGDKVDDSYTHSIDTDSDSDDDKTADEFSHRDSSSFKKSRSDEEDCFAYIMKDDIITKLDRSMPAFVGTANRRVGLPRLKSKPFRLHQFDKEEILIPVESAPVRKTKHPAAVFMFLFVFTLILVYIAATYYL